MKFLTLMTLALVLALPTFAAEPVVLKDGTYSAVFSHVDGHGWKPFLTVTVTGGKITAADFDYVNPKGELKSKNAGYEAAMKKVKGLGPAEYAPQFDAKILAKQNFPVDGIAGATQASTNVNILGAAVLEAARAGKTAKIVLPMDDTYSAVDKSDAQGFAATVAITFKAGKITAVVYDEVKKDATGKVIERRSDKLAAEFAKSSAALVAAGDPKALTAPDRFKAVASAALATRQ